MDKNTSPQFPTIFAENADANTVSTISPAPSHGRASLAKGFPIETMTPLAAGGIPPNGADMNGILKMLSIAAKNSEAGLIRAWDVAYSKEIGGYPWGALVISNGALYLSKADNNSDAPPSDGSDGENWKNILSDIKKAIGDYLPISGGTLTGDIYFWSDGGNGGAWESAPHLHFLLKDIKGDIEIYGQLDANSKPQFVIGVPDKNGDGIFFRFNQEGRLYFQNGATALQAESDGYGRVKVRNLDSVPEGTILANWEDLANLVNGTSSTETDKQVTHIYYRPQDESGGVDFITCEYRDKNGNLGYISLKSYEWVSDNFQPKGDYATKAELNSKPNVVGISGTPLIQAFSAFVPGMSGSSDKASVQINFPQPFKDASQPIVILTAENNENSGAFVADLKKTNNYGNILSQSTWSSYFSCDVHRTDNDYTSATVLIHVIAIGEAA